MDQQERNVSILAALDQALDELETHKPNDRSAADRLYAIARTDLEKIRAYWLTYAVRGGDADHE